MSNNNYYVYKHTNKVNNKVYIGITCQEPTKRWANGSGYRTQHFSRAILKYGWDGFSHEILYEGLSEAQAKVLEVSLIYYYKSTNPKYGYNISEGGDIVHHSEETRKKMSEAQKGENNPNYGKRGAETSFYGKHHTEETKAKISEANKGANHPNYGKTGFNNPTSKAVICTTTGFAFGSISEAGKYYNTNRGNIRSCCKGERKSAGKINGEKLVWKYICDLPKPILTESDKEHLRYIRDRVYNN